ncbi:unnamed protein product [Peniophora sp. CBMAI 1063]|nr:unnamed protein product [Peniophora sp. CBMAI 1063]
MSPQPNNTNTNQGATDVAPLSGHPPPPLSSSSATSSQDLDVQHPSPRVARLDKMRGDRPERSIRATRRDALTTESASSPVGSDHSRAHTPATRYRDVATSPAPPEPLPSLQALGLMERRGDSTSATPVPVKRERTDSPAFAGGPSAKGHTHPRFRNRQYDVSLRTQLAGSDDEDERSEGDDNAYRYRLHTPDDPSPASTYATSFNGIYSSAASSCSDVAPANVRSTSPLTQLSSTPPRTPSPDGLQPARAHTLVYPRSRVDDDCEMDDIDDEEEQQLDARLMPMTMPTRIEQHVHPHMQPYQHPYQYPYSPQVPIPRPQVATKIEPPPPSHHGGVIGPLPGGAPDGDPAGFVVCRWGDCGALFERPSPPNSTRKSYQPNNTTHYAVIGHFKAAHGVDFGTSNAKYQCGWHGCGKSMMGKSFTRHLLDAHMHLEQHRCDACGLAFSRQDALTRHFAKCKGVVTSAMRNGSKRTGRPPTTPFEGKPVGTASTMPSPSPQQPQEMYPQETYAPEMYTPMQMHTPIPIQTPTTQELVRQSSFSRDSSEEPLSQVLKRGRVNKLKGHLTV